jgi:hypothetical protein
MPRPPWLQFAGAVHHVNTRGNARQKIFANDADGEYASTFLLSSTLFITLAGSAFSAFRRS